MAKVASNRRVLAIEYKDSPLWGFGQSLRDFADIEKLFHPLSGGLLIPRISLSDDFAEFYSQSGISHEIDQNMIDSRGARFYAAVDPHTSSEAKADSILHDIAMAQKLVLGHDPNNLSRADYLAYIGALDYIKSGRLTLFHALTYRERRSTVKPSDQYLATRVTLLNDIRTAVRTYYGACIGRHKAVEYNGQEKDAEVRSGLLESQIPNRHWRSPELDHPLTIMANAYTITNDQNHRSRMVDTIVGLPSGGTEVAFAVQYAYGIKNDQEPEPEVLLVPLSAHSGKSEFNEGDHDEVVDSVIENNLLHIVGKNILVPEDNSNTGNTAQVIQKKLMQYGANDVHVTLAAIDPTRISIKQHRWKKTTDTVPHPDLGDDAVTVVPITRAEDTIFSDDRQILKLERLRRLRKEAVKTAPQIEMPNISETDNKQLETIVKVCGVHNSVDMRRAYSAGVRWFGVHLTYDKPDEYKKKSPK